MLHRDKNRFLTNEKTDGKHNVQLAIQYAFTRVHVGYDMADS